MKYEFKVPLLAIPVNLGELRVPHIASSPAIIAAWLTNPQNLWPIWKCE